MYLENVQKRDQGQAAFQFQRKSSPSPLLVDHLSKERIGVQPTIGIANLMQVQPTAIPGLSRWCSIVMVATLSFG
jgi:carbamoyl-phosphate synthase small subunit